MCPRVYVRACPYEQELQEAPVDTERETLLADKTKDTRCVACMHVCMVVPVFGSAVLLRLHLLLSALFLTLEFRIPYHRCGSQAETPCFSGFLVGLLFLCFVAPLGRLRDLVEKVGQELKAKGLSKVRIVYLRSLAVLMPVPERRGRQVDWSLCRRSPLA